MENIKKMWPVLLIIIGYWIYDTYFDAPSSDAMKIAEVMCECSDQVDWDKLIDFDFDQADSLALFDYMETGLSYYACWAESKFFLEFMELDSLSTFIDIENKYVEKF